MHQDRPADTARSRKRRDRARKRTDGAPRLIAPGGKGNPYPKHYAIAWTERVDGKSSRSRVVTTRTASESRARDALIVFKTELARPPAEIDITVRKICDAYAAAKKDEVASHGSLVSALRPIIDAFGPLNPADIQQSNITAYITERLKAPKRRGGPGGVVREVAGTLSRKTVKNELLMFKVACTWAKDEGWSITIPPIKKQKRATTARKRILSRREFGRIMLALESPETALHLRTFVNLALLTGQRRSAILALQWRHIDLDEGKVWFTRARPDAPDNKRVQDHPMTEDMREVLKAALLGAKAARERAAARGNPVEPIDFVIEHKQQRVCSVKTAWHALLARAGAPADIWVHDLRRTMASYVRNSGHSNADVAIYINDSEEITERVYAHADPTLLLPMQQTIAQIMADTRAAAADGGNAEALHTER